MTHSVSYVVEGVECMNFDQGKWMRLMTSVGATRRVLSFLCGQDV